jgi:hypothetical protein
VARNSSKQKGSLSKHYNFKGFFAITTAMNLRQNYEKLAKLDPKGWRGLGLAQRKQIRRHLHAEWFKGFYTQLDGENVYVGESARQEALKTFPTSTLQRKNIMTSYLSSLLSEEVN